MNKDDETLFKEKWASLSEKGKKRAIEVGSFGYFELFREGGGKMKVWNISQDFLKNLQIF